DSRLVALRLFQQRTSPLGIYGPGFAGLDEPGLQSDDGTMNGQALLQGKRLGTAHGLQRHDSFLVLAVAQGLRSHLGILPQLGLSVREMSLESRWRFLGRGH